MQIRQALALAAALLTSLATAAHGRPNIVVVIADDMGYSDIGCYGAAIRTPNIDKLAAGGLRFTNYYVNNMCLVTRASLMTGHYPRTAKPGPLLNPDLTTLPEHLRAAGYTTLMAGKWHLSPHRRSGASSPSDRGFDHWYGIPGGAASFFDPVLLTRDGEDVSAEAREDPGYYFTDALSDEAVKMVDRAIAEDPDRPFFLYLAYTAAHWPLHARDSDIAKYRGAFSAGWDKLRDERFARMAGLGVLPDKATLSPRHPDVPAWDAEQNPAWQQRRMEVYAAQVTVMDEGIGRVVDRLEHHGCLDDTIILYMHDNGACHVEYTRNRKGAYLPEKTRDGRPLIPGNRPDVMPGPENTYQSVGYGWANLGNTPFRLFKQHDHEGGDRSPLVVHWPDKIKKAGTLDHTVCHVTDLLPTLLDAAGIESAGTYAGRSFAPIFDAAPVADRKTIFWKNAKGKALRHGDWKIVAQGKNPWELYNLSEDPTELNDLAPTHPERLAALKARFQSWHSSP